MDLLAYAVMTNDLLTFMTHFLCYPSGVCSNLQTENYALFGDSWTVETEGECAPVCDETEAPPPPEECEHESKAVVEEKCEKLFSVSESVFKVRANLNLWVWTNASVKRNRQK